MFGYIKPQKSELKVRELECYKAVYCGLCRSMGKTCGKSFCGTLSYDFTFLAVVRMGVTRTRPEFEKTRCIAHPFRKRQAVRDNECLSYCSGAAAILGYGKCRDDINDEKGWARLKARLSLPFFARARKKALKKDPALEDLDAKVAELLSRLSEMERSAGDAPSADGFAEIFGEIMGLIVSFGLEGVTGRTAYSFGKAVGHWLYLVDAADDLPEDEKKGRFNPFALIYGKGGFDSDRRGGVAVALTAKLMDAEMALDLMEIGVSEFSEIIKNTIYLGMPFEAKRVLEGKNDR